jgi:glutamine synthetase
VALFEKYKIFSKAESDSRREIYAENYSKTIHIEADTAIEVVGTMILPAVFRYKSVLAVSATSKLQRELLRELDSLIDSLIEKLGKLKQMLQVVLNTPASSTQEEAEYYCHTVLPAMQTLRETVDTLETMTDDELWPIPTYTEMLFVR